MQRIHGFEENRNAELIEGYHAMAEDASREREAEEWSDGLIGDSRLDQQQASRCEERLSSGV